MVRKFIVLMLIILVFLLGCISSTEYVEQPVNTDYSDFDNSAGDIIVAKCKSLCRAENAAGHDLSSGPCIGNPMEDYPDWVCDVAHSPRAAVDNNPANQCSAFREGLANHFVEVDENCDFIKKI